MTAIVKRNGLKKFKDLLLKLTCAGCYAILFQDRDKLCQTSVNLWQNLINNANNYFVKAFDFENQNVFAAEKCKMCSRFTKTKPWVDSPGDNEMAAAVDLGWKTTNNVAGIIVAEADSGRQADKDRSRQRETLEKDNSGECKDIFRKKLPTDTGKERETWQRKGPM